jgi:hypothetical protein
MGMKEPDSRYEQHLSTTRKLARRMYDAGMSRKGQVTVKQFWRCYPQAALPAEGVARRWHCPQAALPAGGFASRWRCTQAALPSGGVTRWWRCPQATPPISLCISSHIYLLATQLLDISCSLSD